ncbi:MAG: S8 family serine peptidase [Actinobacteria bacterium]|nr:S8 family serine peptidase [Actinomycetota bacterium]MCA1719774.1 S8 family serine peptidase [Actinomycetota bacterium]
MRRRTARALALAAALATVAVATPAVAAGTPPQRTWNFDQVRVPPARIAGGSGTGVTVAVLDSWVDRAHKDFEGRVLAGADCIGGTCKDGPATSDKCDHGTHVAGTVASSSFGVAPKARVLPVRVLTYDAGSGNCVGQPDDVAAGIRWAVAHGAQILNLSLGPDVPGLSQSTAIPTAVREAAAADVLVVFSAGNNSLPVTDSYGGDALIVAATSPSGGLASYSQRGSGVDLAAPGGDPKTKDVCTQADCVTSLYPGGRYAVAAGTSMAAPHISGIAALLLSQDPTRTRDQVVERMTSTAHPLAGAGSGVVDAAAALGVKAATTTPRSSTAPQPISAEPSPAAATAAPSPVPAPQRTAALPTLLAAPSGSPVPAPSVEVASPSPVDPPRAAQPKRSDDHSDVPLPLAGFAGGLVLALGSSVAVASRRR